MRTTLVAVRNFTAIALLASASGCLIVGGTDNLVDRQDQLNVPHIAGTPLRVDTENGAITVVKADRPDVQIFAHIRAQTQERLDATKVVTDRAPDQTLAVRVDWPGGKPLSNESCEFSILIPDTAGVTLTSMNGKIDATGLAGLANFRTSNGEVVAEHHSGPIEAHTMNGAVRIKGATESVKAESSNGAVNIQFAPEATGPVEAETSNGAVEVSVGPAFAGEMTLDSGNGEVFVDGSVHAPKVRNNQHHATLTLAPGDGKSHITTSNGAIRLTATKAD